MKVDFKTYKFRCSSIGYLMTDAQYITDKQLAELDRLSKKEKLTDKQRITLGDLINKRDAKPELSKTTKKYLKDVWISEVYGRERDTSSQYTEKGLYCEEDGLNLAMDHYDTLLVKNKVELSNEFIKGTPDCLLKDKVLDIKNSWNIFTFSESDGSNKNYQYQGLGYMALTGRKKFDLVYCLCNAPEYMIVQEKSRRMWKIPNDPEAIAEMEAEVEKDMTFDDIPEKKRIKVFSFDYNEEDMKRVYARIIEAREYLQSIKGL